MMPPAARPTAARALWLIALPLAVALACTLGQSGDPAPTATIAATTAAVDGPVPTAAPAGTAGPLELEVVVGTGPFILPDPQVGLAALASYAATLRLSFEGTQAGQPLQWSQTYALRVLPAPAARQVTVDRSGDPAAALFLAELEGVAYERRGQQACTATALEADASQIDRFLPAAFLTPVIGADAAGSETVNGIAAAHYTFDERALGQDQLTDSTGEVWVAADGGYVVKYLVTNAGDAAFFGDELAGTLTYAYDLSTPAEPLPLPAGCPPGFITAALLPDAANTLSLPGLLSYDTATPLADVAAFYAAHLPAAGWAPLNQPLLTATTALLDFAQGDLQLTVIATTTPAGVTVRLVMVRPAP